jgi:predicted thioesterase
MQTGTLVVELQIKHMTVTAPSKHVTIGQCCFDVDRSEC